MSARRPTLEDYMNINIAADALRFVSVIDDRFGLPTPRSESVDELFGPYVTTLGWGFLKFDAKQRSWIYLDDGVRDEASLPLANETPPAERQALWEAMAALSAGALRSHRPIPPGRSTELHFCLSNGGSRGSSFPS